MRRFGGVLLLLAVVASFGAAWLALDPAQLALRGQRIEGRVAGVVRSPLGPVTLMRPIITYRVNGTERRLLGSGLVGYAAGVALPVLHDRAAGKAMVPGLLEGWAAPAGLFLLALLAGLPGAWLWLRLPRQARVRISAAGLRARQARGEMVTDIRRSIRRSDR